VPKAEWEYIGRNPTEGNKSVRKRVIEHQIRFLPAKIAFVLLYLQRMYQWNFAFAKHGRIFLQADKELESIRKIFQKHNVHTVLDLGCGSGRHLVYLSEHHFDMYGIDIAREGIHLAEEWLRSKKLYATLARGSVYNRLPYRDNFFDAVISTRVLHHAAPERIQKTIAEIERILKPGGLVYITVRKRKLKRSYTKNEVIEKYGKQKTAYRIIGPRMYAPVEGIEKGLTHYLFNRILLKKAFRNFTNISIWVDEEKRHYCLSGEKKRA